MSSGDSKRKRKAMKQKTCFCLAVPREEATFFPACGWFHEKCRGQIQDPSKIYARPRLQDLARRDQLKSLGLIGK